MDVRRFLETGAPGGPDHLRPHDGRDEDNPLPGCSGVRRANMNSKFAPAPASGSIFSAALPARSSIVTDHISVLVTFNAMVALVSARLPADERYDKRRIDQGRQGVRAERLSRMRGVQAPPTASPASPREPSGRRR